MKIKFKTFTAFTLKPEFETEYKQETEKDRCFEPPSGCDWFDQWPPGTVLTATIETLGSDTMYAFISPLSELWTVLAVDNALLDDYAYEIVETDE